MKQITIIYGTSTDNTYSVAEKISKKLEGNKVELINVAKAKAEDLHKTNNIILGTSTWGLGDLQDDWESFLPVLAKAELSGKTIALFGLGDSASYSDTFVNAMGILYETVKDKGCTITGHTSADGYQFDQSKAIENGRFVGLPLDEDNEGNLTDSRLNAWLAAILPAFQ